MTRQEVIDETREDLKKLGIYYGFKEVGIEIYAQSYIDYLKACKEADQHGEINTSQNGMTQVNAYHTQKNHYAAMCKQWWDKLFKEDKLKPDKKAKQSDDLEQFKG